ncbi:MAG: hypothetical protein IJF03_01135 [Lachnospiraceae bacterium]|nr:hypothetical protein [Lachnospiraceae bacterium]
MKLGKTIKKLSAMIMALAMIFSLVGFCGNDITAKAASNPVKLYSSEITFCKYGMTKYDVYIQVDANSATNKKVYVHHTTYDQGWIDTEATYCGRTGSNTEIWKASVSVMGETDYAIKYVGDGVTYWDNNNGQNYEAANTLGTATVKAIPRREQGYIQALVKNLAYNKTVKVRYTEDNWATYKEANLTYSYAIANANAECWATTISVSNPSNFQYCISYTVNGKTYWDNNFGANYNHLFYRAY